MGGPAALRQAGQSLLEFAVVAPILVLLVFGVIDLGRGFYYQTQTTDAARDAARVLIGYGPSIEGSAADADSFTPACVIEDSTCDTDDSKGPGFDAVCDQIQRDLAGTTFTSPACVQMSTPPNATPPYYAACGSSPCDYTPPGPNQATALIYCGMSGDCISPGGGNEGGSGWEANCDAANSGHTCVTVEVVYTFSFLTPGIQNLAGPSLTIQDAAEMVTLW